MQKSLTAHLQRQFQAAMGAHSDETEARTMEFDGKVSSPFTTKLDDTDVYG